MKKSSIFAFLCASASYAMASSPAAPAMGDSPSPLIELVKFLPFIGLFYYFLIHQPKKKAKEHQSAIGALTKGDKVVTTGGIIGSVYKIDDKSNEMTIEIAEGIRVQILKNSVSPFQKETTIASVAEAKRA